MNMYRFQLILVFVVLALLDAMFCAFIAVIHSVRGTDIDKNEEELGPKLVKKLRKIDENEIAYENRALIAIIVVTTMIGGFYLPVTAEYCFDFIVRKMFEGKIPELLSGILAQYLADGLFFVILFVYFVLFLTFVMLIPRRIVRYMPIKKMARFASVVMAVMLLRFVIISLASLSPYSKILAIISASSASKTPSSWPSFTIEMISSSVTSALTAGFLMPNIHKIPFASKLVKSVIGFKTTEIAITTDANRAIFFMGI